MSQYTLEGYLKPVAVVATVVHNGTNNSHYDTVEDFIVQADGEVFLGRSDVVDKTNGLRIAAGQTLNAESLISRGTHASWDLKEIYYIGGPWTLVLVVKA